jgi:beta-N-acetylhexosaminidase
MSARLAILVAYALALGAAFHGGGPPRFGGMGSVSPPQASAFAATMLASAEEPVSREPGHGQPGPSLEAMIGQMILIGFPGTRPEQDSTARVISLIHEGRIGGVVLYDYNIVSPRQVRALNTALGKAGGWLPPFICVDQEGGWIQRLTRAKGFVGLPAAARMPSVSLDKAYELDMRAAHELADAGFNVNFGPVVDLNTNPANPVIGRLGRSFGADPDMVIEYASEFIKAHRQSGVLTVAKHFPGHGSARTDPHYRVVDISSTWSQIELIPYETLIAGDSVDMVMVGHLIEPDFSDAGNTPASLSRRAISDQLRGKLHFHGLIVTDDLNMGAIRSRYSIEQAAVMAVAAGADLLIVNDTDPGIADRVSAAISKAVADGKIRRDQIEQAYRLIINRKLRLAFRHVYAIR